MNIEPYRQHTPFYHHQGKPLVTHRIVGRIMFTSGYGCNEFRQGHVGENLSIEDGYLACQNIALRILNCIWESLGSFCRVDQILFAFGLINCADGFTDLDAVYKGFSDTLYEALGERGICPYTVGGTKNLPVVNTAAEFEVILSVRD